MPELVLVCSTNLLGDFKEITMKMVKFGIIEEDDNGSIVFSKFHIDCEGENKKPEEILLELVIARLHDELNSIRNSS